jgi:NAD(P)H-hydrate repair Nnr-like enzyme with NAD(P)H-hydrate epimerase domain
MLAVTSKQMGLIDGAAVLRDGEAELVRLVGVAIAAIVSRHRGTGPIVAFAGNGNNGGDAFAALAELDGPRVAYHDPAHDGSATRVHARERARLAGVELGRPGFSKKISVAVTGCVAERGSWFVVRGSADCHA